MLEASCKKATPTTAPGSWPGQRLMQSSSDIFLGCEHVEGADGSTRDYYIRQLQDWKGSLDVESVIPTGLTTYGGVCAHALARAHARSGDRFAIASYLGNNPTFEKALTRFAERVRRPERPGLRELRQGLQVRPAPRRRRDLTCPDLGFGWGGTVTKAIPDTTFDPKVCTGVLQWLWSWPSVPRGTGTSNATRSN